MDVDRFWSIIDGAGSPEQLKAAVAELPDDELADFERLYDEIYARSYDWGLWGAAYIIAGGCSDDSFDYFRAYLIGRGRAVYEAALADPDSLADVEDFNDGEEWEDWMSPAMDAIEERTGEYTLGSDVPHPDDPVGDDWEEEDLDARFPRLTAKYG